MKGYKLLDIGLVNERGRVYEYNKKYILRGDLKWNTNGFHFCTHIEDTLRYRDKNKSDFMIVEVLATGDITDGSNVENDYYGYETGYASSEMEIVREVSREEMINIVLNSRNIDRVTRLILSIPLTEEEIESIKEKYPNQIVEQYIEYYQYNNKDAFKRIR